MSDRPSDVMRTWFRRVWTERDERAIYELFPPQGEAYGLGPEPLIGPGAFHQFWVQINAVLQDIEIEVLDCVDDGPRCYVRCAAKAIYRGARVRFEGGALCEIRAGAIVRAWNCWDFLPLMAGMGSLPPDAFALALGGKRFR